ncbi:MAG: polyribonucleotide nucleotidyltransferase [Gemmiger sp.]|uniref:polyribonucleotide nucleotidyltransferase n=2 Tax=Gemmiger sp. TaxID=2049027 RepID=UPI002E78254E|nr:polyribonucleotide nucleotidyltransferase [Gemmiger sp.]MEE0411776.1 polyribonucleotide nucleotidyltransferase [Gemmiger sp.]
MAYEFASRLETFPKYRKFETTFAGRPFVVETGKMCGLSNGSAMIRYGETCVLCNVTMSDKPRDGVDFFPLSVEFEEKLYAAGRIPGSFMRREGRPGEHAILSSRVVDRPIRPLFPKDMRNDVCVTMTVMSLDPDCSAEISGMNGASLAIAMSDIPWGGPIAGVFVGLVDGEIVLNPTKEQREHSDLSLTLAASEEKIVMIEAGANEVDEETMMKAIRAGHEEIKKMLAFINGIVAEIGKPKKSFTPVELDHALLADVYAKHLDEVKAAMDTDDKNVRDAALLPIMDAIAAEHPDLTAADLDLISYKLQKKVVRTWLLEDGKRVDGRGINEIRPLAAEVGLLPRVHGSGMFTRGQTQVLTICTLGSTKDAQLMDDLSDTPYKRYIHHYNFPPYSVGEARAPRSPGRREIGHGNLAERALIPVLPDQAEFPYTIRCVSEVLSSNGSTSQASICGSTLALMDAGVPIKAPVAGISCGLITDGDPLHGGRWMTMVDIQGLEDFFGDMDFKVAGTHEGITAIQMDLKIDGLTPEIVKEALEKTHKARDYILDEIILKCIPAPRAELSKYAPKMLSITIPVDKIREVIGSGGKVIQKICAECDVKVDVEEDGSVFISGTDIDNCNRALTIVKTIVEDPEVGAIYKGRVTRLMDFGAFVEIAPGKEGLVHISRLDVKRTEKVTDVVNVDDEVLVKVLEIDDKGRLNLSRRDALIEVEGLTPENEISDAPRRPRRDDRRGSNGFRPNNNRPRN